MGLWLTVGKVALKVGVPALAKVARERLIAKENKARSESYQVEDAEYHARVKRAERKDRRDRAKAAR